MTEERKREIGRRLAQIALEIGSYVDEYAEEMGMDNVTIEISASRYMHLETPRRCVYGRIHEKPKNSERRRYMVENTCTGIMDLLITDRDDTVREEDGE